MGSIITELQQGRQKVAVMLLDAAETHVLEIAGVQARLYDVLASWDTSTVDTGGGGATITLEDAAGSEMMAWRVGAGESGLVATNLRYPLRMDGLQVQSDHVDASRIYLSLVYQVVMAGAPAV